MPSRWSLRDPSTNYPNPCSNFLGFTITLDPKPFKFKGIVGFAVGPQESLGMWGFGGLGQPLGPRVWGVCGLGCLGFRAFEI